jgi:hypothetical protein
MGTFGAHFGEHFDGPATFADKTAAARALNVEIGAAISARVTNPGEPASVADPALAVAMSPNSAAMFVSKADFEARINTLGQKLKSESTPVTFASDQDALAIYLDAPANSVTGLVTASVLLGGGTANTRNIVNATTYTEQTTEAVRSLKSTSADDTAAGTGARVVRITYYNALCEGPFTVDVTMNGTTAVPTLPTNICFVEKMEVISVGSSGSNSGVISLYANSLGTGTVIGSIGYGTINAGFGDNRTFWGHHYVATGHEATFATFVVSADSGGSGTSAEFNFQAHNPLDPTSPDVIISDLLLATGSVIRTLAYPVKVTGPAHVIIYAVPYVNNAHLNASLDYSEVLA